MKAQLLIDTAKAMVADANGLLAIAPWQTHHRDGKDKDAPFAAGIQDDAD